MIWLRLIRWMWARGTVSGAVMGTLFGTLLAPVFGTLAGLFFGILLGAATGVINGCALAILTYLSFSPPTDTFTYRRSAIVLVSICTVSLCLLLLKVWGTSLLIIPPTIIATVMAGYFAWQFPQYAVKEFAK